MLSSVNDISNMIVMKNFFLSYEKRSSLFYTSARHEWHEPDTNNSSATGGQHERHE